MQTKLTEKNVVTVEYLDHIIARLQIHIARNNHHDFTAKKRLERTVGKRTKLIKTQTQKGGAE